MIEKLRHNVNGNNGNTNTHTKYIYTHRHSQTHTHPTLVNSSFSNAADCRRYVAGSSLIRQRRAATRVRAQCWLTAAVTCRVNRALAAPLPPPLPSRFCHHMPGGIFLLINFNLRHLLES